VDESIQRWLVSIEYRLLDDEPALPQGDQRIPSLNDWLGHAYDGSAVATPRGWITKVTVAADHIVNTISKAEILGDRKIRHCVKTLHLPPNEIVSRSAIDADKYVAELDVYGSRELATLLQVSRQRLAQLRGDGTVPEPDAVLAATPVWRRSTVDGFVWGWRRRPGPVPRTTDATLDQILRGG
jgi:hypothetical protein